MVRVAEESSMAPAAMVLKTWGWSVAERAVLAKVTVIGWMRKKRGDELESVCMNKCNQR